MTKKRTLYHCTKCNKSRFYYYPNRFAVEIDLEKRSTYLFFYGGKIEGVIECNCGLVIHRRGKYVKGALKEVTNQDEDINKFEKFFSQILSTLNE